MTACRILSIVATLLLMSGMFADSWAQCSPARIFSSSGRMGNNIEFDIAGTANTGNQIGYFWDSDDAGNSNSGLAPDYGNRCPIAEWWDEPVPGSDVMRINGAQGVIGCAGAGMGCPVNKMTIVFEDYAAGGPPGVWADAYYAAFIVDETPASGRWYDYGSLDTLPNGSIIPILPFPHVLVTGMSRDGQIIHVNYNLVDQTNMVHSTDWAGGGGIYPTTAVIKESQLVQVQGTSDPGRARSNGWVTIQTVPYVQGGTPASVDVTCVSTATDEFLAIGIGFNGGAYGVIDSALVGAAIPLECDPNLADPEWPVDLDQKPRATQLDPRRDRRSGRR